MALDIHVRDDLVFRWGNDPLLQLLPGDVHRTRVLGLGLGPAAG